MKQEALSSPLLFVVVTEALSHRHLVELLKSCLVQPFRQAQRFLNMMAFNSLPFHNHQRIRHRVATDTMLCSK